MANAPFVLPVLAAPENQGLLRTRRAAILQINRRKQNFRHLLRFPLQEIGNQGKAELLAFFRMELGSYQIVPADNGRNRAAIVGCRDNSNSDRLAAQMIGMDKICVPTVWCRWESPSRIGWSCMTFSVFQPICGIFSVGSDGVISTTSPLIQPRPLVTVFSRPRSAINWVPTQMPKNGRAFSITVSSMRFNHVRHGIQTRPGNRHRHPLPEGRCDLHVGPHQPCRLQLSVAPRSCFARMRVQMPWRRNADCRNRNR